MSNESYNAVDIQLLDYQSLLNSIFLKDSVAEHPEIDK